MRMRLTASLFLTCALFSEMTPSLFTCEFSSFLFRGTLGTVAAVLSNSRADSESIRITQNYLPAKGVFPETK